MKVGGHVHMKPIPYGASMLTELAIKNAKAKDKDHNLSNSEGLSCRNTAGLRSTRGM